MKNSSKPIRQLRLQLAQTAARMLAEGEGRDIQSARMKAAARHHCREKRALPDNREIEQALREYQQLFQRHRQPRELQRLRRLALEAMQHLAAFLPRLNGPVLNGTANEGTPIRLHLYAETPEAIALHLLERRIPFRQRDIRVSFSSGKEQLRPLFMLQADGRDIELLVLTPSERTNPPLDPVNSQPAPGISLEQLRALVDAPEATAPEAS